METEGAFSHLASELEGDPALAALVRSTHVLFQERHLGKSDIPLPEPPPPPPPEPAPAQTVIYVNSEPLREVLNTPTEATERMMEWMGKYKEAWNEERLTKRLVTETWYSFWYAMSSKVGLEHEFQVPECDRTPEELLALKRRNRTVVYLPDKIMADGGMELLASMMPEVRPILSMSMSNPIKEGGWVDVEMGVKPPEWTLNRTAREMQTAFRDRELEGQRLQTYVVASKFRELLDGHFFDQMDEDRSRTRTVLIGSLSHRTHIQPFEILRANDGSFRLDSGAWGRKHELSGFRSEGIRKKTA